ncbi:MAG TPA: hypothetical protein VG917_03080, partial [Patescibacteria group bacterium]|nr:hypothetical protein [Patescibacteria group bacterium]
MVEIDDIKDFSDDRARFGPIHHTVFNEKNKQRPADKNPNDIPEIQTGTGFPPVDPDARKQEIEEMAALIAGPEGLDVGLFESSGGSFY